MAPESKSIAVADDEEIKAARETADKLMSDSDVTTIDSADMYTIAAEMLSDIQERIRKITEKKETVTKPLNAALKAARSLFAPIEEHLDIAKTTLKRKMIAFQDKVAAERAAAQTESNRIRAEEIAQAQANLAAAQYDVEQVEDVEEMSTVGEKLVQAEQAVLVAEVATPYVAATAKPDSGGHALGKTYDTEITNLPAFLRFMADEIEKGDTRFDNTIDIKIGQLKAFGKATQATIPIPGVTFKRASTLAAR